jgi:hypothetical protein
VLFSYQPTHEDELELKVEDVVECLTEVEDGWWRGTLDGKSGVFPSNFVEMLQGPGNTAATTDKRPKVSTTVEVASVRTSQSQRDVETKNRKNEKGEFS